VPEDPFVALLNGDGQPMRDWLAASGVAVDDLRELPYWNTADNRPPFRRTPANLDERVAEAVASAWVALADRPREQAGLLAYLHFESDQAWEVSYHYPPIWATLRGAAARAADVPDPGVAAFRALLEVLDLEIQTENALTSGLLGEAARLSGKAANLAREAARLAGELDDEAMAGYVGEWGQGCAGYDDASARAADGLVELLDGAGTAALDAGLAELGRAEAELRPAAGEYESRELSELRAHRFSLAAVKSVLDEGWLYLDAARVVYLYPFGLRGRPPDEVVGAARDEARTWRLFDVAPVDVPAGFALDDVWDGSDPQERRFDGVRVLLPAVELTAPGGAPLTTLRAELRLSLLGNHYLRLEGDLVDADPQDVFIALLRAAPEHGRIEVTCGTSPRVWPRLADFAMDLVEALAGRTGTKLSARPGMFQVLVDVYAASIGTGPAASYRDEVRSAAQLAEAIGAGVLFHPVPNMVNTMADWIRYRDPDLRQAIPGASILRDHVVVRTCNTTVQFALGLAHWSLGTAGTVAEFAASLEGLFTGWLDELEEYRGRIQELSALADDASAEQLREAYGKLRAEQIRLHRFRTDTRSTLALIESPALVASPVVAEQLVTMVRAAGTRERAAELDRKAEEVLDDRLGRSIETLARQRADRDEAAARRRERRQRARLNTMLAIVAAVGFSGLGQIFQQGYEWKGGTLTWYIILVIVALALVVGLVVALMSGRGGGGSGDAADDG
jgi:hypothetical protein